MTGRPGDRHVALVALDAPDAIEGLRAFLESRLPRPLVTWQVLTGDTLRAAGPTPRDVPLDPSRAAYVFLESDRAVQGTEADDEAFVDAIGDAIEENLVATALIPECETEKRSIQDFVTRLKIEARDG